MQLGQIPLQILVSLGLLICAVIAAIMFDLIKGKNEQLRQTIIQLEAQIQAHQATPAAPALQAKPEGILPQIEEQIPVPRPRIRRSADQTEIAIAPALRLHLVPAAHSHAALSEPEMLTRVERRAPYRNFKLELRMVETSNESGAGHSTHVVIVETSASKTNWGALLSRRLDSSFAEGTFVDTASFETMDTTFNAIPSGYHDGMVLCNLLKSSRPVSGLVVSIGVNGEVTPGVRAMVKSLLGPNDFGCQTALDEFLLIYPGERGASARRKRSEIARQLENYQRRTLNELSILFSWGGAEARSESVETAITAANDQMQETRRGHQATVTSHDSELELALPNAI